MEVFLNLCNILILTCHTDGLICSGPNISFVSLSSDKTIQLCVAVIATERHFVGGLHMKGFMILIESTRDSSCLQWAIGSFPPVDVCCRFHSTHIASHLHLNELYHLLTKASHRHFWSH
ncbi:hypothetical protein NP493_674g01046 [Ridgeia piscesae]|uniref:Secreted protein n=1 Tax=Ridgeia piscesae TaxID=27915 RepID=A0AAD9KRM2_RIDPI|nr:hypothetical protein NP493_674g01046 [Ridgeia piscesae]